MAANPKKSSRYPYLLWSSLAVAFSLTATSFSRADIVRDGSLGTNSAPISGPDYAILPDHGKQAGTNLFHSFSTFNVGTGETATFTSPPEVTSIISRVTGGTPSSIDGAIRSYLSDGATYSSANLYLLNPSGVMFGPNASLDIGGSFHVSTADYLKLSDGSQFFANTSSTSVLTAADPAAFGFLGSNPSGISLDRTTLAVPPGQTLSFIGGDIAAVGDPAAFTYYAAQGGTINIVSVASPGEVALGAHDLGTGSFARLGSINLTEGVNLYVDGLDNTVDPAGNVFIRGGKILIGGGGIYASGNPGGTVDIAGESLTMDAALFYADTNGVTDHPGTAYRIDVLQDFLMINGSAVESSSYGSGRAGDIRIRAGGGTLLGNDEPGTGPFAEYGYYGDIASTSNAAGAGGDLYITTGDLLVQNGFFINTAAKDQGNAGNVTVRADTVRCLNQGNIGSNAISSGSGGIVDVAARDILLSGHDSAAVVNSTQYTGIGAQSDLDSNGGTIKVAATGSLQILDGAKIDTILFGNGAAANIEVSAKDLVISGFTMLDGQPVMSSIDARLFGNLAAGTGGSISVSTDTLRIGNGGSIRTAQFFDATGNSGNIVVNANSIDLASRGQIYADSFRGAGNSGDISINSGSLTITGSKYEPRPEPLDFDFTGLSTTTNSGTGGNITVNLTGDLRLAAAGGIKADTQGSGLGGTVSLTANRIVLNDGSIVNASSTGTGNAGNIDLTGRDSVLLNHAAITTEANADADGGNIAIASPFMVKLIDSKITSSVGGGPETTGGNISIDPRFVVLKESQVVANAFAGTGGNISIVADTFLADPASRVDASSQLGISGTVDIQAPVTSISGLVTPLSSDYVSASTLLRERCIARIREGSTYSSFVVGGRDGLSIEPGAILPTPMY
ncbi:MAG TPA: hypothetical protein DCZ75_16375 [Geobacter sp.]|nr:hypothetical protein [Geobacter sp.]